MSKTELLEANRDALESTYHNMYMNCVAEDDQEMWDALHIYETALVELGILESDEPEEDYEDMLEDDTYAEDLEDE